MNILWIEDEAVLSDGLMHTLQQSGYTVNGDSIPEVEQGRFLSVLSYSG